VEISEKQVERDYQIAGYRSTDLRLISRTRKAYAYLHVKMSDTAGKVILLFLFTCNLRSMKKALQTCTHFIVFINTHNSQPEFVQPNNYIESLYWIYLHHFVQCTREAT